MKIWFDSDGKGASGKRFFAVVEEIMVDKDGKPVYTPAPTPEVVETAPEKVMAVDTADVDLENTTTENEDIVYVDDTELVGIMNDMSEKMDVIIDFLGKNKVAVAAPVVISEETKEEPVEDASEEVAVTDEEVVIPDVVVVPDVAPVEGDVVKAPARRSPCFAEKMMRADELLQDRYDELKNYALRFRKLKARISKKFDSINQGRLQFVKLSIAGKTLKLYLNMDASTTEPKFHCKDVSDKKTYVTVPTLLRIKSGRAVKYAKILIDQCAEQHGLLERRKPFEVDAMALIEEALKGKEEPVVNEEVAVTADEQ